MDRHKYLYTSPMTTMTLSELHTLKRLEATNYVDMVFAESIEKLNVTLSDGRVITTPDKYGKVFSEMRDISNMTLSGIGEIGDSYKVRIDESTSYKQIRNIMIEFAMDSGVCIA